MIDTHTAFLTNGNVNPF